jgi:DNA-binding transcriptional LysR family regulator
MLDWDDLRFFLAVAREGSLSAAAKTLNVTQPTVGRRISGFERALGSKLFTTTPAGRELSAAGRRLLTHAERMEVDALAAERAASGQDVGLRGRVCVTASQWLIASVIGPLLEPFVAAHPDLEMELVADPRHLNLARGEADIAIRPSRFEQHGVVQQKVSAIAFALYASDAYLARYGTPDFARQCEGHRLIVMSRSLRKIPDVEWLPRVASKARTVVWTNEREQMMTMAAAGIGMACLPRFLGDRAPDLRLLPTGVPGPERALWLGVHRDARAVPRIKATTRFLVERIEHLGGALRPAV